jgi:molecular chaperone GrpE
LSQDPVDDPDGQETDDTGADAGAEAALEQPPEAGEAEHLERRARLAEDRLTEVLTAYRQVKVENEGFRDRVTRDVERQFNRRHERLLLKFIDILDNLDRALEAAEQTYAGNPLIEGLILVRTQLLQTLQQEGLERIPVLGLPFDPAMSEAVGTQPVEEPEHDHVVVKEVLRGYKLHGRVARASRVFIGKHVAGGEAAQVAEERIGADETQAEETQADEVPADEARARKAQLEEAQAVAAAATEALADTIPIDEAMMRELFGPPKDDGEEP